MPDALRRPSHPALPSLERRPEAFRPRRVFRREAYEGGIGLPWPAGSQPMLARPRIFPDPFRSATAWFTASWSKFHLRSRGVSDCVGICSPKPYEPHDEEAPVCASPTAGVRAMTAARPIDATVLIMVSLKAGRPEECLIYPDGEDDFRQNKDQYFDHNHLHDLGRRRVSRRACRGRGSVHHRSRGIACARLAARRSSGRSSALRRWRS